MWGIYKLEFPNGKCYIGQSCNLKRRFKDYDHWEKRCTAQTALYNAFKKHGQPNRVILFQHGGMVDQKKLDDLEIQYIQEFNSLVPNGYNIEKGGRGHSGYNCKKVAHLIFNDLPIINKETKIIYQNFNDLLNKEQVSKDIIWKLYGVEESSNCPYHFVDEDRIPYCWGDGTVPEKAFIGDVRSGRATAVINIPKEFNELKRKGILKSGDLIIYANIKRHQYNPPQWALDIINQI